MNSSGWLFKAFNDVIYEYLMNSFPAVEAIHGVSGCFCHFHIQKIKKRGISLQFWDVTQEYNSNAIALANQAVNDT
jgi:hypothetical protein